MSLRPFLRSVLVLLILAGVASASLTAPTTHSVGYKIWGKYWDMMGENGIRNGTIGGAGNVIFLPLNIESCVGNANVLQWNSTNWTCVSISGMTLNNNTFQNSTTINTTIFNVTLITGNGNGMYSLNASNITSGIIPSSVYGTEIVAANVSNFNAAVNLTVDRNLTNYSNTPGYVTNATMDRNASNTTHGVFINKTLPLSAANVSVNNTFSATGNTFAQPDWIPCTLSNNWVNVGGSEAPCGFIKDPFGVVRIRGKVASGAIGDYIFQLPVGYKPSYSSEYAVASNGGSSAARVRINYTGYVIPDAGYSTDMSLSISMVSGPCLSFPEGC